MKPIHPGMKACMSDGGTATVTDVLFDAHDASERYIILSAHGYFGPDVVAPFCTVWHVDDHAHIALSSSEVEALPRFDAHEYLHEQGLCSRAAAHHGMHRHYHAPVEHH